LIAEFPRREARFQMTLSLKLLGEFAVRDADGAALSLPTRKTRALLGYLAANADKRRCCRSGSWATAWRCSTAMRSG
jgi:hypothetical protein